MSKVNLFTLDQEYKVVPERETIMLIPEFAALWDKQYNAGSGRRPGDGRNRARARREITFLYFYCDYRSEFSQFSDQEKKAAALHAAGLPADYRISPRLQAAIDKYLEIQETRELKLLKAAYDTIDKLREYFENVEITDDNAGQIINNMGKIGGLLNGLKTLEEQVRKQQIGTGKVRGDHETGLLV